MVAGDGMFAPYDLVETDNGDIIISQMRRRGLTKINYGTERRDTSFGNSGWFRGTRNDANCGGDDTRLRNVLSMGIDRVDTNDTSDDLIYAADYFGRKIVILNVDGECQDVLRLGFRIRGLTVRTVDGSTYL